MPRKRPPEAMMCCSRMPLARLPTRKSTLPMIPAQALVGPYLPLSLIAATPATKVVSPSERSSGGPSAVHLAAFKKDRSADIVAAAQILDQVVQQIAVARPVPQMMVRIDDRVFGFECGFLGRGEPVLTDRQIAAGRLCLHRVPRESFGSKSATPRQRMPRFNRRHARGASTRAGTSGGHRSATRGQLPARSDAVLLGAPGL